MGAAAAFAGQLRSLGVRIVWHAVERPEPTGRERKTQHRRQHVEPFQA